MPVRTFVWRGCQRERGLMKFQWTPWCWWQCNGEKGAVYHGGWNNIMEMVSIIGLGRKGSLVRWTFLVPDCIWGKVRMAFGSYSNFSYCHIFAIQTFRTRKLDVLGITEHVWFDWLISLCNQRWFEPYYVSSSLPRPPGRIKRIKYNILCIICFGGGRVWDNL